MTHPGTRTVSAARRRSLLALLLLVAGLAAVYVLVGAALGAGAEPLSVDWRNGVALACCAVSAVPLWRWLHDRVHDLADSFHQPYLAVSAASTAADTRSSHTLSVTAAALAKAANLPWVELELDDTGSVGRRVTGATTVEVPVRYRDEVYGVIRVAGRRPGNGLTASDMDLLHEFANELALRVAAERAARRIAESRARIVAAREEERVRIRRDLHDGLAPSLASVQLTLKALQRGLTDDDVHRATVTELIADLQQVSADLRLLVDDLRPPLLDEAGLGGTLRQQFAAIREPTVLLDVGAGTLPPAVEVAVLRIATEAVMNAVRHAGASTVSVSVAPSEDLVRLTVTDDGIGMPAAAVPGVGLSSMRQRAEELGGTLVVESGAGTGTRVRATIGWAS